ncbi:unnamed protein product [Paramecium sonneborni]|uniref:Uncharacterized protein n=1 Tax=Paramecium sonneborni TaxID=65129 RepID=A0A8S1RP92_9CILI|nr:unnamed protein product [Paramecium sonneborni]
MIHQNAIKIQKIKHNCFILVILSIKQMKKDQNSIVKDKWRLSYHM